MRRTKQRAATFAFAALVAAPLASPAATICVEPTGAGGCQTTIPAAVALAAAGDTIDVQAGTYDTTVLVPSGLDGLTIVGNGATLDGKGTTGELIQIRSNNVTLEGLRILHAESDAVVLGEAMAPVQGSRLIGLTIIAPDGSCIVSEGSDQTLVSGCRLISCNDEAVEGNEGDDLGGSDDLIVEKTTIVHGDSGCIDIRGDGAKILGNKMTMCEDDPCVGIEGDNALVEGNKLTQCDYRAVNVVGNGPLIQKNKIFITDSDSIRVEGTNPTIQKNKTSFSGGIKAIVSPCTSGLITGNKISNVKDGSYPGIEANCDAGSGLVISKNTVANTLNSCLVLLGSGITATGNKATNCGGDGTRNGFLIQASNSTLSGNSVKGAASDGFRIEASTVTLDGNKSSGNFGSGFDARADVTGIQLAGNSASGNTGAGFAVRDAATSVLLAGNSSSNNIVDLCQDLGTSTITNGLGNSFSLAAPPICPPAR